MSCNNPNPHKGLLDPNQIAVAKYDCDNEADRVVLAAGVEMSIELNKDDGDSVYSYKKSEVASGAASASGVVVAEQDISDISKICLFCDGDNSAITASVEVSPVSSGDVWVSVATLNPSSKISSVIDVCAKRARVSCVVTSGSANFHLVMKA